MGHYEVVIIQDRWEIDYGLLEHLVSLNRPCTIVRPHADDLVGGCTKPGYCATARNEAAVCGLAEWIVYLASGAQPDEDWLGALEADLARADEVGAAVSIGEEPDEAILGRVSDVAYRRDAILGAGGFELAASADEQEDLLMHVELMRMGQPVLRGTRHALARRG